MTWTEAGIDAGTVGQPGVSVMMVTCNHERFIGQAVESVLAQVTSFDVELVIGEDASTDRTRAILEDYAARFPRKVRLILQPRNVGVVANAMSVLRACRGKYIALLDGDDYWTDVTKLQSQFELMEANPSAILCGARASLVRDLEPVPFGIAPDLESGTLASFGTQELVRGAWWFRTCTVMVPSRLLKRVPARFAGDWSATLWLIGTNAGAPLVFLDRVVGVYRVHSGGAWSGLSTWRQNVRDVRTLCNVIPLFSGENRAHLIGELHARVDRLIENRQAPRPTTLKAAARALACQRDRRSLRNVARSLGIPAFRRPGVVE
jgi:glycosyltransferase involved in cell wall biosynthesis